MWSINNQTKFQTDRAWVRDKSGREVWLVAVRGRFRIVRDQTAVWDESLPQDPVKIAPEFGEKGNGIWLLADTDLVHEKTATDVLMTGHARSPTDDPVTGVKVVMAVGPVNKQAYVFGDREWTMMGPSQPDPFLTMPLDYRRAFGGDDTTEDDENPVFFAPNPVGVGYSRKWRAPIGSPVPNIEDPNTLMTGAMQSPNPMGFGPIAPHWPQRTQYAGTIDAKWEQERMPLLPEDFDVRFHQQAPEDQQVKGFLKGGEEVELQGVVATGLIRFRLPRVAFGIETDFEDQTTIAHQAVLHTVIFEPDLGAVSMVWHTHLECHDRVNLLRETRIWEKSVVKLSELSDAGHA